MSREEEEAADVGSEVSDVNPDELAKMMEEIDFSDDGGGVGGHGNDGRKGASSFSSGLKSSLRSNSGPGSGLSSAKAERRIQFSEDTKGRDDDLSGVLGDSSKKSSVQKGAGDKDTTSGSSSSNNDPAKATAATSDPPPPTRGRPSNLLMFGDGDGDDLLSSGVDGDNNNNRGGSAATPSKAKSDFMDSLFGAGGGRGGRTTRDEGGEAKKEFVLDDKYKSGAGGSKGQQKSPENKTYEATTLSSELGVGRPRRRRGGPEVSPASSHDPPPRPALSAAGEDLDDRLFAGTSLATTSSPAAGAATSSPPDLRRQQHLQGPSSSVTTWLPSAAATSAAAATPATGPSQVAAPPGDVTQRLAADYQQQVAQMRELERQLQEQFQRDLEQQRSRLEARQREHLSALGQQRELCQEQVAALQERQEAVLRQQRAQSEALMSQLHARMESELRMKADLARNQLRILSEIQAQEPGQVLDVKDLLDRLKGGGGGGTEGGKRKTGEMSEREWESLEELESFYRQKEDRLRTAHSEHVEELEARLGALAERNRALLETHDKEMKEERERRTRELREQAEANREAMEAAREEWGRREEMAREAAGKDREAGVAAKSVSHLLSQVSSNTKNLDELQTRVDRTVGKHLDVREEIIRQKDGQIQDLQDRIRNLDASREEESRRLRAEAEAVTKRAREEEAKLDQRERRVRKEEMDVDATKRKFRAEREIERTKLEEERKRVQNERRVVQQEWKSFQLLVSEQNEKLSSERARAAIRARMGREKTGEEEKTEGAGGDEIALGNFPSEVRFELRGALRALREEKSELDTERERLEAGRRRLGEKRETAREERRALAEAAEAMARAEKKYEARIKEMRDFGEECSRLRTECRSYLQTCQRLTGERAEVRSELQAQLEAFERKELHMEEKRRSLVQERKRLWNTKSSIVCSKCKLPLSYPAGGGGSNLVDRHQPPDKRTAGDGQNGLVAAHLAGLRKGALLDEEFLARESKYLREISAEGVAEASTAAATAGHDATAQPNA